LLNCLAGLGVGDVDRGSYRCLEIVSGERGVNGPVIREKLRLRLGEFGRLCGMAAVAVIRGVNGSGRRRQRRSEAGIRTRMVS